MSDQSSLDELLEIEIRAHAIRIAVLSDREFIDGALKGLADELAGSGGKSWDDLKTELKVGQIRR